MNNNSVDQALFDLNRQVETLGRAIDRLREDRAKIEAVSFTVERDPSPTPIPNFAIGSYHYSKEFDLSPFQDVLIVCDAKIATTLDECWLFAYGAAQYVPWRLLSSTIGAGGPFLNAIEMQGVFGKTKMLLLSTSGSVMNRVIVYGRTPK